VLSDGLYRTVPLFTHVHSIRSPDSVSLNTFSAAVHPYPAHISPVPNSVRPSHASLYPLLSKLSGMTPGRFHPSRARNVRELRWNGMIPGRVRGRKSHGRNGTEHLVEEVLLDSVRLWRVSIKKRKARTDFGTIWTTVTAFG
jgi:hypothetical protein